MYCSCNFFINSHFPHSKFTFILKKTWHVTIGIENPAMLLMLNWYRSMGYFMIFTISTYTYSTIWLYQYVYGAMIIYNESKTWIIVQIFWYNFFRNLVIFWRQIRILLNFIDGVALHLQLLRYSCVAWTFEL